MPEGSVSNVTAEAPKNVYGLIYSVRPDNVTDSSADAPLRMKSPVSVPGRAMDFRAVHPKNAPRAIPVMDCGSSTRTSEQQSANAHGPIESRGAPSGTVTLSSPDKAKARSPRTSSDFPNRNDLRLLQPSKARSPMIPISSDPFTDARDVHPAKSARSRVRQPSSSTSSRASQLRHRFRDYELFQSRTCEC